MLKLGVYFSSDPAGLLCAANRKKMMQIEGFLRIRAQPFIIGGDMNVPPEEMMASGWPQRLGGTVYVPPVAYTCQQGERVLDYWIIRSDIIYGIHGTAMDYSSPWRPHCGANAELRSTSNGSPREAPDESA